MTDTQTTALAPVEQRAALALNTTETESHLKALATKHAAITEIKDKAGRDQAHGAGMELKNARLAIQKTGKAAREDAQAFAKAVIAEEQRLILIIDKEEDRLFKLRDGWDAEQERIRAEAAANEQARVARIRAAIDSINALPLNLIHADSAALTKNIGDLETLVIDECYEEFQPHAEHAKAEALDALRKLLQTAVEREEAKRKADEEAAAAARAQKDMEERLRAAEEEARKAKEAQAAAEAALAAAKAPAPAPAPVEVPTLTEAVDLPITMAEEPLDLSVLELTNDEWHVTEQIRAAEVVEAVARALDIDAEEAEQRVLRAAIYLTKNHEEEVAA